MGFLATQLSFAYFQRNSTHQDFNAGNVDRHSSKIVHVFSIRNWSAHQISVKSIATSCGCTTTGSLDQTIQPLHKCNLPVLVDLRNKVGALATQATIQFDNYPTTVLSVHAIVSEINPDHIEFGRIKRGGIVSRAFELASEDRSILTLVHPVSDNPLFQVVVSQSHVNPNNLTVRVSPRTTVQSGEISSRLEFSTSDVQRPTKTVLLSAHVASTVELYPRQVSVGYAHDPQPKQLKLNLLSPNSTSVDVKSVTVRDGRVDWQKKYDGTKDELTIQYTVAPEERTGIIKTVLSVNIETETGIDQIPVDLYGYRFREKVTSGV